MACKAGAGVFCEKLNMKWFISLGGHMTVFQAELFALIEGAAACLNNNIEDSRIVFLSDSQAALLALKRYDCRSKLVKECKDRMNTLGRRNQVVLGWIKGHSGIEGNEIVDQLAKRGAEELFIGPEPAVGLGFNEIKGWIRNKTVESHVKEWEDSQDCMHTKYFIPRIDSTISKYLCKLGKEKVNMAVAVITGHCKLNKHLSRIGVRDSVMCELCGTDEETPYHIICLCPRLANRRYNMWGKFVLSMEEVRKVKLEEVLKFARESGRQF